MLKFFKRQGSQQPRADSFYAEDSFPADDNPPQEAPLPRSTTELSLFEDEGLFDIDFVPDREQSRLSKTLTEVLNDKSALPHFEQFMESRNALPYLRCWQDIQNFQTAMDHHEIEQKSNSDLGTATYATNATHNSQLVQTVQIAKAVEHDSLSVSTDCDDSLAGDISSLNDDPRANAHPTANGFSSPAGSETSARSDANKYSREFTDEALGIFKKYVALEAPERVHCTDEDRNAVVESICALRADCFSKVQAHVHRLMEREYFEAFAQSDHFCKHQIDVLTSGRVVLEDILYNETALFYFMEYLEQENRRYLLEFWLAATNFQQQVRDQRDFLDPVEAQNDAVILYDKYFSLQALCPLGLGDRVRCAVEEHICGVDGLSPDCFAVPLRVVELVLDKQHLRAFLGSQLFCKYLSELINAVQSSGYGVYDERASSSDAGSERSCGAANVPTFLAMEVPQRWEKGERRVAATATAAAAAAADMHIDTRELYDPDALWRRKKHHRLSFGRVTELGQFVTDFEPQPDKKSRTSIRSVVKRFVSLEEDKKKEELAWRVAEMIVKGITSVTLSGREKV